MPGFFMSKSEETVVNDEAPHGMIRDDEYWAYIRSVVDKAPPFTPAQLSKLTALFDYEPPKSGGA